MKKSVLSSVIVNQKKSFGKFVQINIEINIEITNCIITHKYKLFNRFPENIAVFIRIEQMNNR